MTNIATLRKMVNNGWTIANRKKILAHIEKSDLERLSATAKKSGINIEDLKFDLFESHLTPKQRKTFIGDEEFIENDFTNLEQMKLLIKSYETNILPNDANWNSEKFLLFKLLNNNYACQNDNIKILTGTDNKVLTKLKDLLFKTCKPLGRTEVHYRKEGFSFNPYSADCEIHKKLFEEIDLLKAGDTYKPKTFLWTSNNKSLTEIYGRGEKNVRYEIIYPAESKIIEYPSKVLYYGDVTEAVSSKNSTYKIIEKINEGNDIFIKMQLIT